MEKTKKCYFISENNLKTTNCSLEELFRAIDVSISLVIGATDRLDNVPDSVVQFSGLLDLGLVIARSVGLLKNDRTLLRTIENLTTATSLALGSMSKGVYDDVNVSDVLEVLANISSKRDIDQESPTMRVLNEEANANMVNPYQLLELMATKTFDVSKCLCSETALFIFNNNWLEKEDGDLNKRLFEAIFDMQEWELLKVSIEVPLDASFCGTSSTFEVTYEKIGSMEQLSTHDDEEFQISTHRSDLQCQTIVESFLGLLVNSRDELAFANAISGPSCGINQSDFITIKKEAQILKMPLYQVVLSYVHKVSLGGQSLANLKSHPFMEFQKTLVDFANTMDKLQTILEETPAPKLAVSKILAILKSHLSSKTSSSRIFDIVTKMETLHERLTMRKSKMENKLSSPLSGKGPIGIKNIRSIRLILDYFSAQPERNRVPNIHILLGKIQDTVMSPSILPNMVSLFKSPLLDPDFDEADKPFVSKKVKLSAKNKVKRNGKPQFESAMTWAVDSSPLPECATPNGKGIVVFSDGSPLLKTHEKDVDENLENLRKVREAASKELEELRNNSKTLQPVKRRVLCENSNLSKPPKIPKLKKTEDPIAKENQTKEVSQKKDAAKKKKPKTILQIKGQSKITAFLRI